MISKYILIISTDRAGSTHLMWSLSDKLKIPWLDDMFNPKPNSPYYTGKDTLNLYKPSIPVVQKTILSEHHESHGKVSLMNTKPLLSICDWYDRIILLDRRDIKKQMSSYEHSLTPEHRHYKTTATINSQPAPSGIYQTDEEKVQNSLRWLPMFTEMKKSLDFLSKKLGLEVMYYEDLYSSDKTFRKRNLAQVGLMYNEQWFSSTRRLKDGKPWWNPRLEKINKQKGR